MKKTERVVRLVALMCGTNKNGGTWYRVALKQRRKGESPLMREFWLTEEVARAAINRGLIEDVDVVVSAGLDEFLRLDIIDIRPANMEGEVDLDAETALFDD